MSKTLFVLLTYKTTKKSKEMKQKARIRSKCQQSRNLRIPYFTSHKWFISSKFPSIFYDRSKIENKENIYLLQSRVSSYPSNSLPPSLTSLTHLLFIFILLFCDSINISYFNLSRKKGNFAIAKKQKQESQW